jgi:hypothetical protein
MNKASPCVAAIFGVALATQLCCASWVRAQSAIAAPTADNRAAEEMPDHEKSLTEVNKELSNPISTIWSLTFQENTYWLTAPAGHSERNNINLQFQPVLPIGLTENWNLITRPVFQVLNSTPYINESGNLHRVTGFGDTIVATMLSPTDRLTGNWLLAAGPTFIFPTASNSRLGQNKWQLGPAGVVGYLGEKFLAGIFPQQWWSMGGPGSNTISQLNLQYFASYFFGKGWSVTTSPSMLVNWYAPKGQNMLTFPIGVGASKVHRLGILPVRFAVQGQYMPIHPSAFGQKWNIQAVIAPVIPKLIKGDVLE